MFLFYKKNIGHIVKTHGHASLLPVLNIFRFKFLFFLRFRPHRIPNQITDDRSIHYQTEPLGAV